jgi:hypothetical protein
MRTGIPSLCLALLATPLLAVLIGCDEVGYSGIKFYTKGHQQGGDGTGGGDDLGTDPGSGGSGQVGLTELFSGMQIASAPPKVGFVGPSDGDGIALSTPIVAVFSETMKSSTVNAQSFTLSSSSVPPGGGGFPGGGLFPFPGVGDDGGTGGGAVATPVAAQLVTDPDSKQRVFLLLPSTPLMPGTDYTVRLADTITDVTGNPLASDDDEGDGDPGSDPGGDLGGLLGGGASGSAFEATFRTVAANQKAIFAVTAVYPREGESNVAVDVVPKIYFNVPVDSKILRGSPPFLQVAVDGQPWPGTFFLDPVVPQVGGALSARFITAQPFPQDAMVRIRVTRFATAKLSEFVDAGALRLNGGTEDFEATFRTTAVPTPIALAFPDNPPVSFGGQAFDGAISAENAAQFLTDVLLGSSQPVDSVTLLMMQAPSGGLPGIPGLPGAPAVPGAGTPIAKAFTLTTGGQTVRFELDLKAGDETAKFAQSTASTPPSAVVVGAYATVAGQNSPVGPLVLPKLFVETTRPKVTLGPPTVGDDRTFATLLRDPAIYGTASEPLRKLRLVVGAAGIPATFEAIRLGEDTEVSFTALGVSGFMTAPIKEVLPGSSPFSSPRFLPLPIDELLAEDLFGNEFRKVGEKAGEIRQEGTIGGALEPEAPLQLRVRVVGSQGLAPIEGAMVQLAPWPYDALLSPSPVVRKTGSGGEAGFLASELLAFPADVAITVTATGHDLMTLAGLPLPSGESYGVSVPLDRTAAAPATIGVVTNAGVPSQIGGTAPPFVGIAGSGAEPIPGTPGALPISDRRFALAALTGTAGAELAAAKQQPLVVSAMQHDGDGLYVFRQSQLLVPKKDASFVASFAGAGTPALPVSDTFANTVVAKSEITSAGIAGNPLLVSRGRLVAKLPGIPGVFPLSFSPSPFEPGGDPTLRVLFAPIPETLWENEGVADPFYERLLQPDAAIVTAPPSEALLEEAFRFEIEAGEKVGGKPRRTTQRAQLDFEHQVTAVTSEPIDLPLVPTYTAAPAVHPPRLENLLHDVAADDSLIRLTVERPGQERRWTVLVDAASVALASQVIALPPAPVNPFSAPGVFEIAVEVVEFEPGFLDWTSFVLSDIEREQRRSALGLAIEVDTTPP